MYDYDFFSVTFPKEYVAHVQINRPEKLNAFKDPMWANIKAIFEQLSRDSNVRAVVLSGRGDKAFTAGLDVEDATSGGVASGSMQKEDAARTAVHIRRHILDYQQAVTAIAKCEKPVIVVLHGYCFGLAIDMSSAADIRYCAADAKLSVKETDIGLAADVGTLSRLPKIGCPMTWVKEICYTAKIWHPKEALQHGFVSEILDTKAAAVDKAIETADLIASKSPIAVMGTKEFLDYSTDHTVDEGLYYTGIWNAAMLQTKDLKEAMLSGKQKRKVTFSKL